MNAHAMPTKSASAATPRRDRAVAAKPAAVPASAWTAAEEEFVRVNWGFYRPADWPEQLPGRTYAAVRKFAQAHKIEASANRDRRRAAYPDLYRWKGHRKPRPSMWDEDELLILSRNTLADATRMLAPRRTATATHHMFYRLRFAERGPTGRGVPWSAEEIRTVFANDRATARAMLAPKRSIRAVAHMARRLGLVEPAGKPFDAREMALVRNILRSFDALRKKHGRSAVAIRNRVDRERRIQTFAAVAAEAVAAACASLDPAVRRDVEGEVLVAVLSKKIDLAGIPAEVRAARTRIYGPRTFSLDAPIGDGSMRWIDTIADDTARF